MSPMNKILKSELDSNIVQYGMPAPKMWRRVDVGTLETYVGDDVYAMAFINQIPNTIEEMELNNKRAEETVIRYLQAEGFIGKEYIYMGLQRFDLQHLPQGFELD